MERCQWGMGQMPRLKPIRLLRPYSGDCAISGQVSTTPATAPAAEIAMPNLIGNPQPSLIGPPTNWLSRPGRGPRPIVLASIYGNLRNDRHCVKNEASRHFSRISSRLPIRVVSSRSLALALVLSSQLYFRGLTRLADWPWYLGAHPTITPFRHDDYGLPVCPTCRPTAYIVSVGRTGIRTFCPAHPTLCLLEIDAN